MAMVDRPGGWRCRPVRRAEVVGTLSLATDLGMGLPLETGLRAAVLAAGLARAARAEESVAADAYALALLRFIGCTADASGVNDFFGDEIAFNAEAVPRFYGNPLSALRFMLGRAGTGQPPVERMATLARFVATAKHRMAESTAAHCEVATMLAPRLSFSDTTAGLLLHIYDRYDGHASSARGASIPLAARIMHVAFDAAACHAVSGVDAAIGLVRSRAGKGYDPEVSRVFCSDAAQLCTPLEDSSIWQTAIDAEPGHRPTLDDNALDRALEAMADFADLKSAYTRGHSRAVSELAAAAAHVMRLPEASVLDVRRAGLVHDLGRLTVPVTVWDRPGALTADERERVRLHAYYTQRILHPSPGLRSFGDLASLHHERLDGSGYHTGCRASSLSVAARILAAADRFRTLTESRPHRSAYTPREAARRLRSDVTAGRLDGHVIEAVLDAAGHGTRAPSRHVAGLTSREVEVLGLIASGLTTGQVARRLGVSAKTADHHVQSIYTKAGVATRAAATLFALQHGLVGQVDES
jgi:HD-GYP domain-containing protein (c-di-GMP phosphodiesterase class II)